MEAHPERKLLPHVIPHWVDPRTAIYFITVCCQERGCNQLARPEVAGPLLETVRYRSARQEWFAHIFLIMPDHIHGLFSFPPSDRTMQRTISLWKSHVARQLGVRWQRDFFEHRLRNEASRLAKADYILANPVRQGLVLKPEDWPHVLIAGNW